MLPLLPTQSTPSTPHTPLLPKTCMQGFLQNNCDGQNTIIQNHSRLNSNQNFLSVTEWMLQNHPFHLQSCRPQLGWPHSPHASTHAYDHCSCILSLIFCPCTCLCSSVYFCICIHSLKFSFQELTDSVKQSVSAVKTVKQSIFSLVTSIPKVQTRPH